MRKGSQTNIPGRRALRRSTKLLAPAFLGAKLNPNGPHLAFLAFLAWVFDRKSPILV